MAVRFGTQVEADHDGIWAYVAKESGSVDFANRVIDSITDHFFLLSRHPQLGRRRDDDLRRACEPCQSADMSSFTALRIRMF
jgi:plasmid stabilization system protein ParE